MTGRCSTAIVYVLTSGCAWRHLPPSFGVTVPTAHRRFTTWVAAGVFERLHGEATNANTSPASATSPPHSPASRNYPHETSS